MLSSISAQSAAVSAMGPRWSRDLLSGTTPSVDTSPRVGFRPVTPQQEAGIRIEKQTGRSDVNALTVDTFEFAPRISASYALRSDARTLLIGSYGRFNDGILQGFSDTFAAVPQQTNYNPFVWNGSSYDFVSRFDQAASTFAPNTSVNAAAIFTLLPLQGLQSRLGRGRRR